MNDLVAYALFTLMAVVPVVVFSRHGATALLVIGTALLGIAMAAAQRSAACGSESCSWIDVSLYGFVFGVPCCAVGGVAALARAVRARRAIRFPETR